MAMKRCTGRIVNQRAPHRSRNIVFLLLIVLWSSRTNATRCDSPCSALAFHVPILSSSRIFRRKRRHSKSALQHGSCARRHLAAVHHADESPSDSNTERQSHRRTELAHGRRIATETLDKGMPRRGDSGRPSSQTDEKESDAPKIRVVPSSGGEESTGTPSFHLASHDTDPWNRDGAALATSVLTVPIMGRSRRSRCPNSTSISPTPLIRMVVISDTHGFEDQLFRDRNNRNATTTHPAATEPSSLLLPDADVLIHCGDFAASGARTTKLEARNRLDHWMAAQTHIRHKIVLRGNHDPHHARSNLFPKSQATYITKPTTLRLNNVPNANKKTSTITLCVRPYSRRQNVVLLPDECDVLVTHEPPFGILDRTYTSSNVGSKSLRRVVQGSRNKPTLWLCGHIHEGRGSYLHSFVEPSRSSGSEGIGCNPTLVVNAANANSGRANQVVTGPLVVELVDGCSNSVMELAWNASCSAAESRARTTDASPLFHPTRRDSLEAMRLRASSDRLCSSNISRTTPKRLLAVDLGHRTATALLDDTGTLLEVRRWRITDKATLDAALYEMLVDVTHVVIETSDPKLYRIWKRAVGEHAPNIQFARVLRDDWKAHFLTGKESENKQSVKGASVAIARQLWDSSLNGEQNDKRLVKEGAQAMLVAYYAIGKLGWADEAKTTPKRYTNGDIVVR